MAEIRTFRDLLVWQYGMSLAEEIYRVTRSMPKSEIFGLTQQMRRAATSIPFNIAEGFAKRTPAEYLRGQRIAAGSLAELDTQWELTHRLGLLQPDPVVDDLMRREDRLLSALMGKLEERRE